MTNGEKISVLYLDDEEHNLSAFKATFRRTHDVRTAGSSEEAMEMIGQREPQIIIADQRMPKVTGIEFFQTVQESHPDPLRVLLTAYTSSQTVIDAVNKGKIDRYLVKPWDREMMEETLKVSSEIYRNKIEVKRRNEELYRINNELNRFVYSVSHDLRAPLLSMLGLVDLCKMEEDPEQVKEYFQLVESSIRKMDEYIKTTLEYYRNLKSKLIIEKVDLKELIEEIAEPLKNYNQFVRFSLKIEDGACLHTDRVRLKIALNNLISNAVKYGYQAPGTEYLITVSVNKGAANTKISVMDEGKGIAADQLKNIFEIFYSASAGKSIDSTGLGLYLVKQSVEKLKGEVDVRSKVGVGSEFEITLPDLKEEA